MIIAFEDVVVPHEAVEVPVEEHTAPVEDSHVSTNSNEDTYNSSHPYVYPFWLYNHHTSTGTASASCTPSTCDLSGWAILLGLGGVVLIVGIIYWIGKSLSY